MISERIRRYTSPNENFEYGYPHSNALLTFPFKKTVKMYFVAPIRQAAASFIKPLASCIYLGDYCIQNSHLGRYIVWFTVGNLVLRRHVSGAVKRDFRTNIRRYTSPNENFEYGYPHSNALLTFSLQKGSENVLCCAYIQLHKTACQLHIFTCQPMQSDVGFATVYRRIYCRKFLTLSNQT